MSFLSTKTRRNINSFYNYTKNFFFFKKLFIYNLNTHLFLFNEIKIEFNFNSIFLIIFSPLVILKYNLFDYIYIFYVIYLIIVLLLYIIIKHIHKNMYKYKYLANIKKDKNKIKNNFNYFYLFKEYKSKLNNLLFKIHLNSKIKNKIYLVNKLFEGSNLTIENDDKVILFFKKYKIFNIFYRFYNIPYKTFNRNNKDLMIYSFNESLLKMLNIYLFYIIFIIPLCFIDYLLHKYDLILTILKKYRFLLLIKIFLDNFNILIKLNRLLGDYNVHSKN